MKQTGGGEVIDWWFLERPNADMNVETVLGEFFSTESTSVADSLVREFIQNSLDASNSSQPVKVAFRLGQLDPSQASRYTAGLPPHFKASDIEGMFKGVFEGTCRYLVAEDFETHGLRGDPGETFRDPQITYPSSNDFYYFVRSQGASEKSSKKLGTWGVGKFTYPMTSDINTLFAYTVRADASGPGGMGPLLIGQSFLRNHQIGSVKYKPHGWWSQLEGDPTNPLPMPFGPESEVLRQFEDDFTLNRQSEPGLAIVIPFIDRELNAAALLRSVLLNYSATILLEQLVVQVVDEDNNRLSLDAANVVSFARSFDPAVWKEIGPEIELLQWWATTGRTNPLTLGMPPIATQTSWLDRISDTEREIISASLQEGVPLVVRVPIHVQTQPGVKVAGIAAGTWSYADVILNSDEVSTSRITPSHYREGLRISAVKCTKPVGVRTITVVEDGPLARMVALSEGPAHTDWSSRSRNFAKKFKNGRDILGFVKDLGAGLVRHARSSDTEEAKNLAPDVFSPKKPRGERTTGNSPPTTPPVPTVPPAIRIDRRMGGFRVVAGPEANEGATVTLLMAYELGRGNAFRQWTKWDFEVTDLDINYSGLLMTFCADNQLVFTIENPNDLELEVLGFDRNRDVIVKAAL